MKRTYDNIAFFYDRLSSLVFGDAILKAEQFLAEAIPAGAAILIAGGGTGRILEVIAKKHPKGLHITYADISAKMIALAKERNSGSNTVSFINANILQVQQPLMFDVVITPFFLDNFSNHTASLVFKKLHEYLKPGGLWLFADFQVAGKNNLWQKLLLKIMYFFFRLVCNVEASSLPDTEALFAQYNLKAVIKETFCRKFIYGVVYRKA